MNKKRLGFNIIDVLIIFIVAGICAAVAIRLDLANRVGAAGETFEVTFMVSSIQERSAYEYLNVGDILFQHPTGTRLGVITEIVDRRLAVHYSETNDGDIVKTFRSNRRDVVFKIEASGRITNEGHLINGVFFVGAGKEVFVRSGHLSAWMVVVAVDS